MAPPDRPLMGPGPSNPYPEATGAFGNDVAAIGAGKGEAPRLDAPNEVLGR